MKYNYKNTLKLHLTMTCINYCQVTDMTKIKYQHEIYHKHIYIYQHYIHRYQIDINIIYIYIYRHCTTCLQSSPTHNTNTQHKHTTHFGVVFCCVLRAFLLIFVIQLKRSSARGVRACVCVCVRVCVCVCVCV